MARKMLKQAIMIGTLVLLAAVQQAYADGGSGEAWGRSDPNPSLPGAMIQAESRAYANYNYRKENLEAAGYQVFYNGNSDSYTQSGGQYEALVIIYYYWVY